MTESEVRKIIQREVAKGLGFVAIAVVLAVILYGLGMKIGWLP